MGPGNGEKSAGGPARAAGLEVGFASGGVEEKGDRADAEETQEGNVEVGGHRHEDEHGVPPAEAGLGLPPDGCGGDSGVELGKGQTFAGAVFDERGCVRTGEGLSGEEVADGHETGKACFLF